MHLRIEITRLILIALAVVAANAPALSLNSDPEPAPIVERQMDFYDFNFKAADGRAFNLRDYATGKRVVIVSFVAGWCSNSNRNGHVLKRLYDKYRDRGLGAVVVTEYSDADEVRIHVNRIGIDYPVVMETSSRGDRKDSRHYKYRHSVGDKRKWGTPFYVILDARDIEASAPKAPLARRVFTVSGELVEAEAEAFIEQHIPARQN
jgi:peroxiredoxin